MISGQGRCFMLLKDVNGARIAYLRAQQFLYPYPERIGKTPSDGDRGIRLFALDLRQHGLGYPGGPRQILQCQSPLQAKSLF